MVVRVNKYINNFEGDYQPKPGQLVAFGTGGRYVTMGVVMHRMARS